MLAELLNKSRNQLTSAKFAFRISSCSWRNFFSISSLSLSAISRSCRSLTSLFLSICLRCLSSFACAFICWISIVSGFLRLRKSSWLPMHRSSMSLFTFSFRENSMKLGRFLSMNLMVNLLSSNEMFLISLHWNTERGWSLFSYNERLRFVCEYDILLTRKLQLTFS